MLEAHRDELQGGRRAEVERVLALGLSSRRNICVHPQVSLETERNIVDQECRKRTASWVRARRGMEMSPMRSIEGGSGAADIELLGEGGALCSFYERLDEQGTDAVLGPGVYTLEELKELGRLKGWCPYYLARYNISFANVVVYNYQYLLDPKISALVSKSMQERIRSYAAIDVHSRGAHA